MGRVRFQELLEDPEPHWVYRFSDEAGACLYVGMSRRPAARFAQHGADKDWWPAVVTVEMTRFPDRAAAAQAEREEIRARAPVHNVHHNLDEVGNLRRPELNAPRAPNRPPFLDDSAERFREEMLRMADAWWGRLFAAESRLPPNTQMSLVGVVGWILGTDRAALADAAARRPRLPIPGGY